MTMTEAKRRRLVDRLRKMAAEPLIALSDHPTLLEVASALATPASDGLPEGWKAVFARRDGGDAAAWYDQGDQQWRVCPNVPPIEFIPNWETVEVSVSSLSEACLAANDRFPVVKPEAAKWVKIHAFQWERSDGMIVRQIDYGWIVCHSGPDPLPVLNTAEEAMAWADRERTVT